MVPGNEVLYPLGNTGYAVPPGETLRELLDERGLTQRDLARRADLSPKHVNPSDDVIDSGNTIAAPSQLLLESSPKTVPCHRASSSCYSASTTAWPTPVR